MTWTKTDVLGHKKLKHNEWFSFSGATGNDPQQLFHQMGRDGVPLDEASNPMSRMSHLKGRRQHARKKPSQTHVLASDINHHKVNAKHVDKTTPKQHPNHTHCANSAHNKDAPKFQQLSCRIHPSHKNCQLRQLTNSSETRLSLPAHHAPARMCQQCERGRWHGELPSSPNHTQHADSPTLQPVLLQSIGTADRSSISSSCSQRQKQQSANQVAAQTRVFISDTYHQGQNN